MSDFCYPFIADDSFDPAACIGDLFFDQFQDPAVAKSGPLLSMSSYEKVSRRDMLGELRENRGVVQLLILLQSLMQARRTSSPLPMPTTTGHMLPNNTTSMFIQLALQTRSYTIRKMRTLEWYQTPVTSPCLLQ